jgi:hypothetical protein
VAAHDPYGVEETALINETVYDCLNSGDPARQKQAASAVQEFVRDSVREDSFAEQILPSIPCANDELTRVTWTDKPMVIIDKEPSSPAAVTVPYRTLPMNYYIRGSRFMISMNRVMTRRFTKDVDEFRTWIMDIRQVISDNAIKDMLAERDSKFLSCVDMLLVGPGVTVPHSGVVQHQELNGGINRNNLWRMLEIMPSTNSNFEVQTCLINNITIKRICAFGRNEMGGDVAQDIMKDGWSMQVFMGKRWIVTIKKSLVPNNRVYMFAEPRCTGRSIELESTTMHIHREAFFIEFFAYWNGGGAIANTNSVAAADFV